MLTQQLAEFRGVDLGRLPQIPRFESIEQFVENLAEHRGRAIELTALPLDPTGICGLAVSTPQRDLIIISDALFGVHRDHVILHEIGHLLLGHVAAANAADDLGAALTASGRYEDDKEFAAEVVATHYQAQLLGLHRRCWVSSRLGRASARELSLFR